MAATSPEESSSHLIGVVPDPSKSRPHLKTVSPVFAGALSWSMVFVAVPVASGT